MDASSPAQTLSSVSLRVSSLDLSDSSAVDRFCARIDCSERRQSACSLALLSSASRPTTCGSGYQ